MSPSWSDITKSGLPKAPPSTKPQSKQSEQAQTKHTEEAQPTMSKGEYASSVKIPQLEVKMPSQTIRIGDIEIALEKYSRELKLPVYISQAPEEWNDPHSKRRGRRDSKTSIPTIEIPPAVDLSVEQPQTPTQSDSEPKPKPKPSSWAALLKPPGGSTAATNGSSTASAKYAEVDSNGVVKHQKFKSLEDALQNLQVVFNPPAVQPRGLVNTGNMCFMNVVLQALLYCAPFYNMLWSIKENVAFSFKATTPLLEALLQYVNEFKPDTTPLAQLEDGPGEPFVPENVYEALRKKNVFQTLRGQQEDAQEFMSYLVDGIHEEMVGILQQHKLNGARQAAATSPTSPSANDVGADSGSDWLEVGPHNKASLVRDNNESIIRTPITQIFGGTLRSTLTVPHSTGGGSSGTYGQGAPKPPQSSNREPFQWLALDISANGVDTVEDALNEFVAPEIIEGYTNLHGESVNATKQILLEKAPPVLVFHLKRFVFCYNEGVQKVHRFIEYPQMLSMSPKWFAKTTEAAKYKCAKYRLESVIYHHGSQASGGHYTCDLRRSKDEWLRFDDVDIECLDSVDDALAEKKDRTAYILFYTICN